MNLVTKQLSSLEGMENTLTMNYINEGVPVPAELPLLQRCQGSKVLDELYAEINISKIVIINKNRVFILKNNASFETTTDFMYDGFDLLTDSRYKSNQKLSRNRAKRMIEKARFVIPLNKAYNLPVLLQAGVLLQDYL